MTPKGDIDLVWILVCSALVMGMQVGFCMLEAGLVRSKNTINVAIKNLLDFCVAGILFWAVSYALMFGFAPTGWFGSSGFFFDAHGMQTPYQAAFMIFQLMFCATSATIVSGAVAERMSFGGYLGVTAVISAVIYPIAGCWAWNPNGWLKQLGFVDFAGSTVVHGTGGWLALAAVSIIGPRVGRFDSKTALASSHSLGISTLGVLFLFVAWLGFNGGSALGLTPEVPSIIFNTILGGCAGCLAALVTSWKVKGLPLLPPTLNGCVAGLVAVTAGCHSFTPAEAVLVGAIGGVISFFGVEWLEKVKLDDVVGASAAHAMPGVWGTLAVAFFGDPKLLGTGLGFGGQLGVQALGVVVFLAWSGGVGWLLISLLNRIHPLRVSVEFERAGLNVAEHGASTEIIDLLGEMSRHSSQGDFANALKFEPFTEVGQIATEYNKVIGKVVDEMDLREGVAKRLAEEREALDTSRAKILSSIEYAGRIQQAILPRRELLDQNLPPHYIFYRPRDIVSGDFYWCAKVGGSVFFAVVDCTGHGVPGAFMSMIGYVTLQQIVVEGGETSPSQILKRMHARVRTALGQDLPGAENRDGMDVALIRIDPDRIIYAGAGRPLFWTSEKHQSVECGDIRGDRHSVGGGRHESKDLDFTEHILPRVVGLRVFLFSDGLVDQPNSLREPFDKSRLRTHLKNFSRRTIHDLGQGLENLFDEFRGGSAVRDDVTFVALDVAPFAVFEPHEVGQERERLLIQIEGPVSQSAIAGHGRAIKELQGIKPTVRHLLFGVFVELAQNVLRHSAETVILPEGRCGCGSVHLTETEDAFLLESRNPTEVDKAEEVQQAIARFSQMQQYELETLAKENLRKPKLFAQGAGLGLIEVVRRADEVHCTIEKMPLGDIVISVKTKVNK